MPTSLYNTANRRNKGTALIRIARVYRVGQSRDIGEREMAGSLYFGHFTFRLFFLLLGTRNRKY